MLERGAVDAIAFPWGSLRSLGLDKAVKYHLDVPLYVTPFVWVMNKARYASLSTAQKRAVDDHCSTEWAERVAAPWAEFESGGHAKLAQPGHDTYPLTPEQLKAWREAAAPLEGQWAEAAKKAGEDPKKVLESLKASLVTHKAAL
jgi:TRAP-type C4-dicarboxylate transport system substrate-binding protein